MAINLDPKISLADAKTITLAGEEYWIPRLMLRQTIIIAPMMSAALPMLNRRARAFASLSGRIDPALKIEDIGDDDRQALVEAMAFSQDDAEIALKIVHAALTRAYPSVRIDDLYDMPIKAGELIVAIPTIFAQSDTAKEAKGEPTPGEAQAAILSIG